MNIDERNMTMRQMIDKLNKTVKDIDSLKFIIDAVKRQPELEKKEWTANDSNVVIGETYYIQSVGVYKIKGTGKGKISWTVKSPKDMKVLYQGQMDDTAESDEMILTAGDVCYLNASADGGETLVMALEQTQSLFEMMGTDLVQLQSSVESLNERLGNALTGVDTKVDEAVETVKDALRYVTPEMSGSTIQVCYAKPTSKRPASLKNTEQDRGFMMFDITLNKPIWWTGTKWVDATGSAV